MNKELLEFEVCGPPIYGQKYIISLAKDNFGELLNFEEIKESNRKFKEKYGEVPVGQFPKEIK